MLRDGLKITGAVEITLFDKNGDVKDTRSIKNLVVTTGKTFIAARMVGTPAVMSHLAIGEGTTAAAVGNTTLGTEVGRVALASATSSGAVVAYTATFGAGTGTGAITEAGIFNSNTAGTLLCRSVFSVVNKGVDDGMTITWTVTIS